MWNRIKKAVPWPRILLESSYWCVRAISCRPIRGIALALFIFIIPYVEYKRDVSPFRVDSVLDFPAYIGNLLYAAPKNLLEFPINVLTGHWASARENFFAVAGVRTQLFDNIHNYNHLNQAEWYAWNGLWVFLLLTALSASTYWYDSKVWKKWRHPRGKHPLRRAWLRFYYKNIRRRRRDPICQSFNSIADTLGFAFTTLFLLGNTTRYFQESTKVLDWVTSIGNILVTGIDFGFGIGWQVKEILGQAFYFIGPGKEQTLGALANLPGAESLSHYLDDYPSIALNPVFAVGLYYAFLAWIFSRLAFHARDRWWLTIKRTWRVVASKRRE